MGVKAAVVLAPIRPQAPVEKTAHNLDLTNRTKIAIMEAAQVATITMMSRIIKQSIQTVSLSAIRNPRFVSFCAFLLWSIILDSLFRIFLPLEAGIYLWVCGMIDWTELESAPSSVAFLYEFSSVSKMIKVSCTRDNQQNKWPIFSVSHTYRKSCLPCSMFHRKNWLLSNVQRLKPGLPDSYDSYSYF